MGMADGEGRPRAESLRAVWEKTVTAASMIFFLLSITYVAFLFSIKNSFLFFLYKRLKTLNCVSY